MRNFMTQGTFKTPRFFLIFIALLGLAACNQGAVTLLQAQKKELPKDPPKLKLSDPLPGNLFVELARIANPSVVNISTLASMGGSSNGMNRDPLFEMLEKLYGLRRNNPQQKRPLSMGTGFIIREDGLIITNNHVIQNADVIQIQLSEKSEKNYVAKVIGTDDRTDIALLKIEGGTFPALTLGSSSSTEVGEWVAAFGNPFGNGHTMTKGIISAKGRDINEINKFPLLQTDAPINPGNSGGPLVNTRGQVIGVNSAIDGRAQGIGFAIPIDDVKSILPILEKSGKIKKGYLGVAFSEQLDPQLARALKLTSLEGALVAQVEKGGPADKAGVKPYDVILEVNGKKVASPGDLFYIIGDSAVGSTARLEVIRKGEKKSIPVVLGERPDSEPRTARRSQDAEGRRFKGEKAPFDFGIRVADPSNEIREAFDLPKGVKNPVIVEVTANSLADQVGLAPGDMILDVNQPEEERLWTAKDVVKAMKPGTNTLRIQRGPAIIFITVDLKG